MPAPEVVVGVRPEHFEVGNLGVEMEIDVVEELGADAYLYGRIINGGAMIDQSVVARADGSNPPERVVGCGCIHNRRNCTSLPSTAAVSLEPQRSDRVHAPAPEPSVVRRAAYRQIDSIGLPWRP